TPLAELRRTIPHLLDVPLWRSQLGMGRRNSLFRRENIRSCPDIFPSHFATFRPRSILKRCLSYRPIFDLTGELGLNLRAASNAPKIGCPSRRLGPQIVFSSV